MPRVARSVGVTVAPEMRPALDEVVAHFANGNRSEFLRLAIRDYQARLRLERMHALRARAREDLGGKTLTIEEIDALIRADRKAQEKAGTDKAAAGADPT